VATGVLLTEVEQMKKDQEKQLLQYLGGLQAGPCLLENCQKKWADLLEATPPEDRKLLSVWLEVMMLKFHDFLKEGGQSLELTGKESFSKSIHKLRVSGEHPKVLPSAHIAFSMVIRIFNTLSRNYSREELGIIDFINEVVAISYQVAATSLEDSEYIKENLQHQVRGDQLEDLEVQALVTAWTARILCRFLSNKLEEILWERAEFERGLDAGYEGSGYRPTSLVYADGYESGQLAAQRRGWGKTRGPRPNEYIETEKRRVKSSIQGKTTRGTEETNRTS
jgi:hypothetical protein